MRAEWDERARTNAFHYVSSFRDDWDRETFYAGGEDQARKIVDSFLQAQRIDPKKLVTLEIGCGPGRLSRALSRRFRFVFAYDVSPVMIKLATGMNAHLTNVEFIANDGESFPDVKDKSIDFVFSGWTMQHMPTEEVVRSNICEITRILKPDGWYLIDLPLKSRSSVAMRPVRSVVARALAFLGVIDDLKVGDTYRGIRLSRPAARTMLQNYGLTMNALLFDESPNASRKILDEWTFGRKEESERVQTSLSG